MPNENSRDSPSPRYVRLLNEYLQLHTESERIFSGGSLADHLPDIRRMVAKSGAKTLLDYGSGKGALYKLRSSEIKGIGMVESVAGYLGVDEITCYDPAVAEFSAFPQGKFDGVISTDALEHVPEEDMAWVVGEMFAAADKFVFANVASFAAQKNLPSGENAHATQRPWQWWRDFLSTVSSKHPDIQYCFLVEERRRFLPWIFGKIKVSKLVGGL